MAHWFSENVSVELSDGVKKALKEALEENDFDEEMLKIADEHDFKSVIPQNWSLKNRIYLVKAFKQFNGMQVSFFHLFSVCFPSLIFVLFYCCR